MADTVVMADTVLEDMVDLGIIQKLIVQLAWFKTIAMIEIDTEATEATVATESVPTVREIWNFFK